MSAAESFDAAPSLVDLLLAEQRSLHAVDEFSAWHERSSAGSARFETLIPSALPGEGQQFAFVVDLDVCTGCKACVTACHSLNGLEDGETWRKVGELEGDTNAGSGFGHVQTVTAACHHCERPACLEGCPVQAYEKDAATGIVIHLDDQCIGCRYCQLMCPYDVPQFSQRLGIVRKCDMCHGRLAAGEAPACVQGCPNEAISIGIVDRAHDGSASDREARSARSDEVMLLPVVSGGMPRSSLTGPTTRYVSARGLPKDLRPVESAAPRPSEGHTPLAVMLVLVQASVGALTWERMLAALAPASGTSLLARDVALLVTAIAGFAGLAASTLHLGRPLWAFRSFLGLRTSWMSREIVAFGAYAGLLVAALATTAARGLVASGAEFTGFGGLVANVGAAASSGWLEALARLEPVVRSAALATGLVGFVCSVQIYAVTGRPMWRADRTALRFGSTLLLLGAVVVAFAWCVARVGSGARASDAVGVGLALPVAVIGLAFAKRVLELGRFVHGEAGFDEAALARTRALLGGSLAPARRLQRALGLLGGVGLPLVGLGLHFTAVPPLAGALVFAFALAVSVGAEIAERSLFFRSEAMRGMPGTFAGGVATKRATGACEIGRSV